MIFYIIGSNTKNYIDEIRVIKELGHNNHSLTEYSLKVFLFVSFRC